VSGPTERVFKIREGDAGAQKKDWKRLCCAGRSIRISDLFIVYLKVRGARAQGKVEYECSKTQPGNVGSVTIAH
jgi:hypothetical protein